MRLEGVSHDERHLIHVENFSRVTTGFSHFFDLNNACNALGETHVVGFRFSRRPCVFFECANVLDAGEAVTIEAVAT